MKEKQGITPQALLNRPDLPIELVPTYNAFTILNYARGGNMAGQQPIKVSEVAAYLALIGETCREQRARTLRLISEMDSTYMAHQAKKAAT
jgi:hypothetical protein